MNGICCASIGLIFITAVILWEQEGLQYLGLFWPIVTILIVVICFALLQKDFAIPLVFVIGGLLYLTMNWLRETL